jgi:hypothetical protein
VGTWVSTHVIFSLLLKTGHLGWANAPYVVLIRVFKRLTLSEISYTADHLEVSFHSKKKRKKYKVDSRLSGVNGKLISQDN